MELKNTAEQAVIGSLLIDPRCAGLVFEKLRSVNFSDPICKSLFAALHKLFLEGKAIDPIVACNTAEIRDYEYVAEIMRLTPTAANVGEYAELVKEHSRCRELQSIGLELAGIKSFEEGLEALSRAESLLTAKPTRRVATYAEMIGRYLDRQQDSRPPDYINFGFESLNKLNVSPGKFVIIGADSSVGKTAFALQLGVNMARNGKRVGFFSYETAEPDVIDRVLANTADVAMPRSKSKSLSGTDIQRVITEGMAAELVPFTLIEAAEYTVEDLRAETLAGRFDAIFIDYIQLIPGSGRSERWQTVTEASMALHSMAQRLGVTIFALSQVTLPEKRKDGSRPLLRKENLRESRQLILDADAILMMDLENPALRQSPRIIIVDKNKDGPLAEIRMSFDPIHMRFSPITTEKRRQNAPEAIAGQQQFVELSEAETGKLPF